MLRSDLTPDEIAAIRAARLKEREVGWQKLFKQYWTDGDLEDVVNFSDDDGCYISENDDDDAEMEAAGNGIEKQKKNVRSGAPNESCVGVPSDEEEQQEFFNAFHMYAQQRIETVEQVYQKHTAEETISEDGRNYRSKHESFVEKRQSTVKNDNRLMANTPRRSLAPKSLSYALKGGNEQQAINVNNNIGLELVKPVHNFGVDKHVDGVVSTIDQSIINSPVLQKNGFYEKTVTTTTTTTVTVTKKVTFDTNTAEDSEFLEPIEVDDADELSPTKENLSYQTNFSTPKNSNRTRRTHHESYSAMQYSEPSKRLSYVQFEVASTTPKSTKSSKQSPRSAIMRLTGKDVQKSVKAQYPSVDTHRLKDRQFEIGPRESLLVECPPEVSSVEKKGDFLSQLKAEKLAFIVKEIDNSF